MRVVVLMSTYQGERWVGEQIRSILCQLPLDGRLLVRDDGSTDQTVACVESISDRRIEVLRGPNIGYVRSFHALLAQVPADAEMIMLADQDDIWLPQKIDRAWRIIGRSGATPMLYCSRLKLVDADLAPIGLSPHWPRAPSFQNALTENIVTGCTAAMNRAALSLVRQSGDTSRIYFHDWWFYLVIAAFGHVVFDPEPTILYRQHGRNAIGMGAGIGRYLTILRFVLRQSWTHIMFNQIENFRSVHGASLSRSQRLMMDQLFDPHSCLSVVRLLLAPIRMRQSIIGDMLFRGMILGDAVCGRGLLPKHLRQ